MDPNPIKHVGSLLKSVRERLEPILFATGYSFVDRNRPEHLGAPRWLDYESERGVLSIRYEPHSARLVGELVSGDTVQFYVETALNQPRSARELEARIREFVAEVDAAIVR